MNLLFNIRGRAERTANGSLIMNVNSSKNITYVKVTITLFYIDNR
jgi:hypothetical protein